MPKMGDSMEVGKLLSWRFKSGDTVKSGDIIAEIETDKSNVEIEAEDNGVFRTTVQVGAEVPVGDVIATIGDSVVSTTPKSVETIVPVKVAALEPGRSTLSMSTNGQLTPAPSQERIKASPPCSTCGRTSGTSTSRRLPVPGPNGRVIEADVISFAAKPAAPAPQVSKPEPVAEPVANTGAVQELSQMRARYCAAYGREQDDNPSLLHHGRSGHGRGNGTAREAEQL